MLLCQQAFVFQIMYNVLDQDGSGTIDCTEMLSTIDNFLREV